AAGGRDLRLARSFPHHDEAVDALVRRAPRERLRMVAGGDADHAPFLLVRRERGELVEDAPHLERARLLEQLRLEHHVAQARGGEHRRSVHPAGDRHGRAKDVISPHGGGHLLTIPGAGFATLTVHKESEYRRLRLLYPFVFRVRGGVIDMATGTVKWFNDAKGYGFIAPDEGGKDLFVHHTNIVGQGFKSLSENAKVEFESREGQKGPEAINVQAI